MYDAKRAGTGYAVFAAEQEEAPARRLALLGDLRHCIEQDELVLHYQPKIDLETARDIRRRGPDPLEPPLRPALFSPASSCPRSSATS